MSMIKTKEFYFVFPANLEEAKEKLSFLSTNLKCALLKHFKASEGENISLLWFFAGIKAVVSKGEAWKEEVKKHKEKIIDVFIDEKEAKRAAKEFVKDFNP